MFSSVAGFAAIVLLVSCLSWPERPDPTLAELISLNHKLAEQTEVLKKISTYTRDATVCLMYMIQSAQGQTMPEPQAPEKPKFRAEIPSRPSSPVFSF